MKTAVTFSINNFKEFKDKMLNWANQFSIFCLLDNNEYEFSKPAFECLLAVGCDNLFERSAGTNFTALANFAKQNNDWLFGHISYDAKNYVEKLSSSNFDGIHFPDVCFFAPQIVVKLTKHEVTIFAESNWKQLFNEIEGTANRNNTSNGNINVKARLSKEEYIHRVEKLRQHILKGDCYEINFCQEFFCEHTVIEPISVYKNLCEVSPMPFAALYKLNDKYCICASPERYLKKEANIVLSQPIKGTIKRNTENKLQDDINKQKLFESAKERSENVMVVDLVRNDLSKVCTKASVCVSELFGVYTFPQVHQMISTVKGEVAETTNWADIISATFPMGSMTGVPKKKVMELIEHYEETKRGLFSGCIGYVTPEMDFDFNVVIRSIFHNSTTQYLCYQVGSAITYLSNANDEYEECLLKSVAIKEVLK